MGKRGKARKYDVHESVNLDFLRRAMEWVIDPGIFQDLRTHGNTKWIAEDLVMLAVLWVWSEKSQLTGAFGEARVWSKRLFGRIAVGSYQGLTGALVNYGAQLVPLLWNQLHRRMKQVGKEHWRIGRWLPLAVDGSRISTPRTKANEKAFRAANYGKSDSAKYRKKKGKNKRKKNRVKAQTVTPQIWLTLLWHMGMRLPWSWRMGPSNSSETSAALAIQVVRSILFLWREVPQDGSDLITQLQNAVIDTYKRHSQKRSRYQPNKKDKPTADKPIIKTATSEHKQKLKRYRQHLADATSPRVAQTLTSSHLLLPGLR